MLSSTAEILPILRGQTIPVGSWYIKITINYVAKSSWSKSESGLCAFPSSIPADWVQPKSGCGVTGYHEGRHGPAVQYFKIEGQNSFSPKNTRAYTMIHLVL